MTKQSWYIAGGVVVAVALAWLAFGSRGDGQLAVDLLAPEQFQNAQKRPSPETFEIVDATIGGQEKRAIQVKESSRLVYAFTVPENAELRVSPALLENAWTVEGDGVLFRVLIEANSVQDELLNLYLNPFANSGERGWHDIVLDLSDYAGENVQLFFNTNASPPSLPQRDDSNGDFAVWGAPRVVSH
jgi:hypothetical protein